MSHNESTAPGAPGEVRKRRKPLTPEHRANIAAAMTGKSASPATKKKMRLAKLGRKRPLGPEARRLAEEWQREWDCPQGK